MKMTNAQIYNCGAALRTFIADNEELSLPVRVNFFLQKNLTIILEACTDIEKYRMQIGEKYGSLSQNESGYEVAPENIAKAQGELNELMAIEQDLPIKTIALEDFGNIQLKTREMAALFFMIEEPSEKGESL